MFVHQQEVVVVSAVAATLAAAPFSQTSVAQLLRPISIAGRPVLISAKPGSVASPSAIVGRTGQLIGKPVQLIRSPRLSSAQLVSLSGHFVAAAGSTTVQVGITNNSSWASWRCFDLFQIPYIVRLQNQL